MVDKILRCLGANEEFSLQVIDSRDLVEKSRLTHDDSPDATRYLGELLSAGAMMADQLKGEKDLLTVQVEGDGPLGKAIVTANAQGEVKGYVKGCKESGGIGNGFLTVIRDQGMRYPYNSTVPLEGKNLSESLMAYYNESEQIPTYFALGVKLKSDGSVSSSLGYMVQMLPFAGEEEKKAILANLQAMPSMDSLLEKDASPEKIMGLLLSGLSELKTAEKKVEFHCRCSHERGLQLVRSLGREQIQEIVDEGKPIDITCGFCGKSYHYELGEIAALLK